MINFFGTILLLFNILQWYNVQAKINYKYPGRAGLAAGLKQTPTLKPAPTPSQVQPNTAQAQDVVKTSATSVAETKTVPPQATEVSKVEPVMAPAAILTNAKTSSVLPTSEKKPLPSVQKTETNALSKPTAPSLQKAPTTTSTRAQIIIAQATDLTNKPPAYMGRKEVFSPVIPSQASLVRATQAEEAQTKPVEVPDLDETSLDVVKDIQGITVVTKEELVTYDYTVTEFVTKYDPKNVKTVYVTSTVTLDELKKH